MNFLHMLTDWLLGGRLERLTKAVTERSCFGTIEQKYLGRNNK